MKLFSKIKNVFAKDEKKNDNIDDYTKELLRKNGEFIQKMNAKIAGY